MKKHRPQNLLSSWYGCGIVDLNMRVFFINFVDNVGGFLVKGLVMYPSTHFPSFSLHSPYPVRLSYWYLVPTLSSLDTDVCSCYGSSLICFSY